MRVCALASLLTLWHAAAVAADATNDHMRACVSEADDARRLACYDKAMGRTPGQPADFGLTPELIRKKQVQAGVSPAAPAKLSAAVTRVATQAFGRIAVTLDNGQVWAQQDDQEFPINPGDVVTIKAGLLGAIWMQHPSRNIQTRVKRVK